MHLYVPYREKLMRYCNLQKCMHLRISNKSDNIAPWNNNKIRRIYSFLKFAVCNIKNMRTVF